MGEVEGEGMLIRWELIEGEAGVAGASEELTELDEVDEMETERGLCRVMMGIGSERMGFLVKFSFEDIFVLWKRQEDEGSKKGAGCVISDFIILESCQFNLFTWSYVIISSSGISLCRCSLQRLSKHYGTLLLVGRRPRFLL